MLRISIFLFVSCLSLSYLTGQHSFSIEKTLKWNETQLIDKTSGQEYFTFEGGIFGTQFPVAMMFSERKALSGRARVEATLTVLESETFDKKTSFWDKNISSEYSTEVSLEQERYKYFARVECMPVRRNGSTWERATKVRIDVKSYPLPPIVDERGGPFTLNSVLETGDIYKFAVNKSGVTKLTYDFLKNQLGISDLDNIDPKTIKLYGNGGEMLPETNGVERVDDLLENAIFVSDGGDGNFGVNDYILFYAEGPSIWSYRPHATATELTVTNNLFDRQAYYFVKISAGNGLRVGSLSSLSANEVIEEFDDFRRYEVDEFNLLHEFNQAQGSGKDFFGDYFLQTRLRDYSEYFYFPNTVKGSSARIRARFASRSEAFTSIQLSADGESFSRTISGTSISNNEALYAQIGIAGGTFLVKNDSLQVRLNYPNISSPSEGWLDYIEVNVKRQLKMAGKEMSFRNISTLSATNKQKYRITDVSGTNPMVWDITNPQVPAIQEVNQSGSTVEFGFDGQGTLKDYVIFYSDAEFAIPSAPIGRIENQNYHGIENADLVIVYHSDFEAATNRLAEHRRNHSDYTVATINVEKLYNEFSSGAKDISAIRDFARMMMERDVNFRYLLLFGDGSFDPKANYESPDNLDFIPVFETANSMSPIDAHPSDDFFALLSDGEGGDLKGALDIGVGRIPVRFVTDAEAIVDKIIDYDISPSTLGDWHLRNVFIADDEDGNVHLLQAEKLAKETAEDEAFFNIEKVYFDAYQQIATSAGERYPEAKASVNTNIFKGALVVNYIGHGGPRGWGQERVVDNNDIIGWENTNRTPLFITATCTFGGYDDFQFNAGGELMILKPKTGAIALFTTVRPVYISGNNQLTNAVQDYLFTKNAEGQYLTMGDILATSKNNLSSGNEANARRFTMFGDPSQFLAMPEHRVYTTKINGAVPDPTNPDTLRALQSVELEGQVRDFENNHLSSYNGVVSVTVYDKPQTLQTLGQDAGSPVVQFSVQRNILFRGSATVTNGDFKIKFIVPKDINYTFGEGKISYYAHNNTHIDAAGSDFSIQIGGNSNQIQDDQPPLVQVFMNDEQFAFGGITDENPKIFVKLSDDNGINVSGTSIGHDLNGIVDENVQAGIVLNDFFESALDDYTSGTVLYPLRGLKPGRHKVSVKAWDVANNSGEGFTEFVVADDEGAVIKQVLNYPNPFTTSTSFQFEHNLAGQVLDAQISIYTVAGNLVKTINATGQATGYRVSDVNWNGRDDFGDRIGRGVYLYRIKLRGTDFNGNQVTAESDFQKLVLLK